MSDKHRNDMYGDIEKKSAEEVDPPIPAATVVLLRDGASGVEVLMLRRNSKISFGGMWVFPGGRIDPGDYASGTSADDPDIAARNAAVRETQEEAGIVTHPDDFVWFAHWSPPPSTQKRFATWFFAARAQVDQPIRIDGGEIQDHAWINPGAALAKHGAGEIDLVPPTWVTLYHLSRYAPVDAALEHFRSQPPKTYQTRVAKQADGVRAALWHGDAGYEDWNAEIEGPRHRLVMSPGGFVFENTIEAY